MARNEERELERALSQFEDYLGVRNFNLSANAALSLRKYVTEKERKKKILSQLSKKEKTSTDLVEGFKRLAAIALEIAQSKGRKNITGRDIEEAIKRIFCKVWPFCK